MSSQRYSEAVAAGAGWNRWVIYWDDVETSPGVYDWSNVDQVVAADTAQHLNVDAVLLGTPSFYATSSTATTLSIPANAPSGGLRSLTADATSVPSGLYNPTFADGTDVWASGKAINPQNPWAEFVYAAVSRYHNQIHDWEIWNEPDFSQFWTGSLPDYIRLLKVAYLAAHAADANAKILVGGMMYWQWANAYGDEAWLQQFIADLKQDPSAPANNYFFDVIPWHWYSRSSDVYTHTITAESMLAQAGINGKQMWLNETNAPACNETVNGNYVNCADYGNQTSNGNWAMGYATDYEQASFIIQAFAYGFAAGMTRVFQFQLQDDGNPQAFGMFRNDGSARPEYLADQLAVQYLEGFTTVQRTTEGGADMVTFGIPGPNPRRVTVMWNDTGQQTTATLQAAGVAPTSVTLVQQDGTEQSIQPASQYSVVLPPATDNRNYDSPWNPTDYIIGGPTFFLVENLPPDTTPPTSCATVPAYAVNQSSYLVSWSGSDPNGWGIMNYTIQYRDVTTGPSWTNWLTNTTATSAPFTPTPGQTYQFRSLAKDWAGNVESKSAGQFDASVTSPNTLSGQSATPMPYSLYLPLIGRGAPVPFPMPSC